MAGSCRAMARQGLAMHRPHISAELALRERRMKDDLVMSLEQRPGKPHHTCFKQHAIYATRIIVRSTPVDIKNWIDFVLVFAPRNAQLDISKSPYSIVYSK